MQKMNRILLIHGLDPSKTNILETITENGKSIVLVENEGIKYMLDGNNKTIVSSEENVTEEVIENTIDIENYKRPKSWHFRAIFVDIDGTVYKRGVEQPELKGTLPPSIN